MFSVLASLRADGHSHIKSPLSLRMLPDPFAPVSLAR